MSVWRCHAEPGNRGRLKMVKARVPLINGIRSLAYRLFRNQDDSLKACVRLSKTGNAECGTACRPRRACPEAHSCGVALLAKGYGHYRRSASCTCTLQITQRPYAINQRCLNWLPASSSLLCMACIKPWLGGLPQELLMLLQTPGIQFSFNGATCILGKLDFPR